MTSDEGTAWIRRVDGSETFFVGTVRDATYTRTESPEDAAPINPGPLTMTVTQELTPERADAFRVMFDGMENWYALTVDGEVRCHFQCDDYGRMVRVRKLDGTEQEVDPPFPIMLWIEQQLARESNG